VHRGGKNKPQPPEAEAIAAATQALGGLEVVSLDRRGTIRVHGDRGEQRLAFDTRFLGCSRTASSW